MDEKSFWSIGAWSSCCIRNFKRSNSVVWGIHSSNLCKEMSNRMLNNYWACTARGSHKCDKCHFAFLAKLPFFWSLHTWCHWLALTFWIVWQIRLIFTALHCPSYHSKHGKHQKHGPSFACHGWWLGTQSPLPTHQFGQGQKFKNRLFILLEPFRKIIVLNHFEGLYNTLQFESQGLDSSLNGIWIA